jgi:single-stranded-DNA-specific exonuclease
MPAEAGLFDPAAEARAATPVQYALGVAHSFSARAWRFRSYDEAQSRALSLSGTSAALAQILAARGVTRDSASSFLEPRLKTLLPEPYRIAHMESAVSRFADAVARRERIAVFGDYDVDGACAAALLMKYLRALGAEPLLYIPDRIREGYGPSEAAVRLLHADGARLLVTVDCGAASHDAFAAARAIGLDAIVIDHHAVEANPPVFAHVNPNGPDDLSGFTYVCSAGLVFIFLVAVQRHLRGKGWFVTSGLSEVDLLTYLDLVALATIADVVPLIGVNRAFVHQGLRKLQRLERPGLAALARLASVAPPFSPYHLGFIFGPRINAGGRVGRCDLGARLLASDDAVEADQLASALDVNNRERQAIESSIIEAAQAIAASQSDKTCLLIAGEGWHQGVVGIVAGRLKERHAKPVFVAGFDAGKPDSVGRGSARSVPGIDIGALVRRARADGLLEAGGGHAMAAGFSLRRDKVDRFREFLDTGLEIERKTISMARDLIADAIVSAGGATLLLLDDLERAGPFGAGNPEPVFLMPDMLVAYAEVVGGNHVRLRLTSRDGAAIGAIAFREAETSLGQGLLKARGRRVHVTGKLKRDEYGGAARVQLHLEDAAPAGA